MSYRYPFTASPRGWFFVPIINNETFAFGKKWKLNTLHNGKLVLQALNNPERILPVLQKDGDTFAFYDEMFNESFFDIPNVPEFNDDNWNKPFTLFWQIRVHAQEVAENALDLSHFCVVHTYKTIPQLSQFYTDGHQFNVIMHTQRKVWGIENDSTMEIMYHGMGVVISNVCISSGLTLKVLLTTTPIDQEFVSIRMKITFKKMSNPIKNWMYKRMLPKEIKAEFDRDIPVWEAKIYREKPLLCRNEANIARIRQWAKQFYITPHDKVSMELA